MNSDILKIRGTVSSRSSRNPGKGPPGEAALAALNPGRDAAIMAATGWQSVFPGTLNLSVRDKDFARLLYCRPQMTLAPPEYPPEYASLPERRVGYMYFAADMTSGDREAKGVLVRRPMRPGEGLDDNAADRRRTLEVLAPVGLRDLFGFADGAEVILRVRVSAHTLPEPTVIRTAEGVPIEVIPPAPPGALVCRAQGKDENDWKAFRHHRSKMAGAVYLPSEYRDEFRQPMPHFFTAEGAHLPIEGIMRGGHAFLICGGPSLREVDMSPLRFVWTLCMNNSVKACMPHFRPSAWVYVDSADSFLYTTWADPKIMKFAPQNQTEKALWNSDAKTSFDRCPRQCPNTIYYHRNERFDAGQFFDEDTFNWGNHKKCVDANGHGGARSVMHVGLKIPFVLGFRTLYLVGCDFKMSDDAQHNYGFDQARHPGAVHGNNSSYRQMTWRFEQLQPEALKRGYRIFNCNEQSELKAFPYKSLPEAISDALSFASGSPDDYMAGKLEATAGLYDSKWYVCPKCTKDQRHSGAACRAEDENGKNVGAKCITEGCGFRFTRKNRKKYSKNDWNTFGQED